MNKLMLMLIVLFIVPSALSITIHDNFMVGIYEPGIDEYQYKTGIDNISQYRPKISADGDVVIDWWIVMQTGTIPPGEFGYIYSKFGVETPVPGIAHEYYSYDLSTFAIIINWIHTLFGGASEIEYPFLPPMLFDRIEVDCDGDAAFENEFDYYQYPINPSGRAATELNDAIWEAPVAALYEPPFPQQIEVVRCFYDYEETSKFKFTTNITVRYSLSPNYWSVFPFSNNRVNIYPGYFLSTTVAGFSLASCGRKGSIKNFRWWPSQEAGCTFEVRYPVTTTGFGKPVGIAVSNGTNIPGGAGYGQGISIDDDTDTIRECHDLYENSPDLLHLCLQQIAFKDMQDNNNLYSFGISAIRMTFSFILLMFYILSITVIGYVFGTLIPSIFRKIMLIFSRATRLK